MIKYRLGFTMSAETLFALVAKVLPIEDLSVEEIAPVPVKAGRQLADSGPHPQLAKPKRRSPAPRKNGYAANLDAGTNAIILKVLADGKPHRTREIKDAFVAGGYNPNGTGSSMARQEKWGLIEHVGVGMWQLTKEQRQKQSA